MRDTVRAFFAIAAAGAVLALPACSATDGGGTSGSAPSLSARTGAVTTGAPEPSNGSRGAATAGTLTIAAVGDTMLGDTPNLPSDPASYFHAVESTLDRGAQIVFGNLEGTLTTSTGSKCGPVSRPDPDCFAFRDPPGYARYFKQAGFTILNDANNHSFDFGAAGQAQTVRTIHAAGMAQTGLPGEITVVKADGVTVAFLAFAP